jgi:hypothetical protein
MLALAGSRGPVRSAAARQNSRSKNKVQKQHFLGRSLLGASVSPLRGCASAVRFQLPGSALERRYFRGVLTSMSAFEAAISCVFSVFDNLNSLLTCWSVTIP